jgi:ABC-2 type transport system permease protein
MFQTPIDVFLERGDPLGALAGQLVWVVLLLAAGRVVLRRGARRLVVQGG